MAKNSNIKYLTFEDAKKYIKNLGFKNKAQFFEWAKSNKKPPEIPKNPESKIAYKDKWQGWGDFLSTGNVRYGSIKFREFSKAKEYARALNLKSNVEWSNFARTKDFPKDIPANPSKCSQYKNEWKNWSDWLGNQYDRRPLRSFENARKYVQSLNFKSRADWKRFTQSNDIPFDIPKRPDAVKEYKDFFTSWDDWLGVKIKSYNPLDYLPFVEARKFAQGLNLKSKPEWVEYYKNHPLPPKIPHNPNIVYKAEWNGIDDWLGTNRKPPNVKYMTYKKAREFVHSLKLKSMKEWRKYYDDNKSHLKLIPKNPSRYPEWIGHADWLGIDAKNRHQSLNRSTILPFVEARAFVRKLNLQSIDEWTSYANKSDFPEDVIPRHPKNAYGKEWTTYTDWIGKNFWSEAHLLAFIKSLKQIINQLEPAELYSIIKNNNLLTSMKNLDDSSPVKQALDFLLNDEKNKAEEIIDKIIAGEEPLEDIEGNEIQDENDLAEKNLSNEIGFDQDQIGETENKDLPEMEIKDVLNNLDHIEKVMGISDEETITFLINRAIAKLWSNLLRNNLSDIDVISKIRGHIGLDYSRQVKDQFLSQYDGANNLKLPDGYDFKINGEQIKPNLMQKLIAYRLATDKRIGNWSGTGAGKTLGAILAAEYIQSKLTIIIGLNNTILSETTGWAGEIKAAFPNSHVHIKERKNFKFKPSQSDYLLLNYESFQLAESKRFIDEILDNHKVD